MIILFTCWLRAFYAALNFEDFTFKFFCGCNKIFQQNKLLTMVIKKLLYYNNTQQQ